MSAATENLPLTDDELEMLLQRQSGTEVSSVSARVRLLESIHNAIEEAENSLITAPTGLGKTHEVATVPWLDFPEITDDEPVIHISQTREARDTAVEMSQEGGLDYTVLRARHEVCPVAAGEYDDALLAPNGRSPSAWFDLKCDVEQIQFSIAHNHLESHLGDLPCTRGSPCQSQTQWVDVPRNEVGDPAYDIIHATAPFAKVPNLVQGANVIIDELPDFTLNFRQEQIRRAINGLFLQRASDRNLTWERFIEDARSHTDSPGIDADPIEGHPLLEYRQLVRDDIDDAFDAEVGRDVHTLAPAICRAIIDAEDRGNNRYAGSDSGISVVFDDQNTLRVIHARPDLAGARCVIGLDAHPSELLWELNTDVRLQLTNSLAEDERGNWRTTERGLFVVQIGENTNPLTLGWRNDRQQNEVRTIIRELRRKVGGAFRTAIVPQSVEEDIESMMVEAGIDGPELLHYGEERSLNIFAGERVGLLIGCIDPGDDYILDRLAIMGQHAEPEMQEVEDGVRRRAYGRGFVGEDADAANEYLQSVRETHVAQSIGRYARNPRDTQSAAIVYCWTDAIPDGMIDFQVAGLTSQLSAENRLSEGREAIDEFVRNHSGPVIKRLVADEVGVSDRYAWEVLGDMEEQGIVRRSRRSGPNGADVYEYVSGSLGPTVDLSLQRP